jgi:hypothetical protein
MVATYVVKAAKLAAVTLSIREMMRQEPDVSRAMYYLFWAAFLSI